MDDKPKYVKLKDLVGKTFTVEKSWGYKWKMWDPGSSRMIVMDEWKEGFSKSYELDTNQGKLNLSSAQLGGCLEAVFKDGVANLIGETIEVKSNGKAGMEIRYFFNRVPSVAESTQQLKQEIDSQPAPMDDDPLAGIDQMEEPLG